MNAVVLAGGLRSGLEMPGSGLPRALWPFPSQPLISQVLWFLMRRGCQKLSICANGKTRLIASELASGTAPWMNLHYSEDRLPRGPAGCLRDLQEWLGGDTFVVIQASGSYDFDLALMLDDHRRSDAAVTVGALPSADDPDRLEPAGVYLVEPRTLGLIPAIGYQDLKEQFLPRVIASAMTVRCHVLRGRATLIHSPDHYLSAMSEAISRAARNAAGHCTLRSPDIVVHESARVHPTARLIGPVWIDGGAEVEEDTVLVGPVVVGPGSRIGAGAVVHRSVLMRSCTIGRRAQVNSAIMPPGARCAAPKRHAAGANAAEGVRQRRWPVSILRDGAARMLAFLRPDPGAAAR